MRFKDEPYEYMVYMFGGIFDPPFDSMHTKDRGVKFFGSKEERQKYIDEIHNAERFFGSYPTTIVLEEGKHVRYRTVAIVDFKYKDKNYQVVYDLGHAFPLDLAKHMIMYGGLSCDCSRSRSIRDRYGDVIPELECGQEIEILDMNLERMK